MSKNFLLTAAALVILAVPFHGHAQVSLTIDGHSVVPAGQLETIEYRPGTRELVVRSVHADWRCSADPARNTPSVRSDDFKLIFDQVNASTEPGAVYSIASPLDGGSIVQNLADGVFEIQTSSDASVQLTCAPFRASFFAGDFENLFRLDDTAPNIAAAGSTLTIPFTITNRSESEVATAVEVDFTSNFEPATTEIVGPTFIPVTGTMLGNTWRIDILYPGDSASIAVEYDVGTATPDGTVVGTGIADVRALNRAGDAALGTGAPTLSTSVPIGTAELSLLKTGTLNDDDGTAGVSAGDTISYSFEVTNISDVTLTDIRIDDPLVTVDGGPVASLAPGASDADTFSATYTLTQEDVDAGSVTNLATVTSAEGAIASDQDTRTFSATAAVSLDKTGQVLDSDDLVGLSAGDTIEYSFTITNTGNATLTDLSVSDAGAAISGTPIASLPPGASDSTAFTGSYTITQADIDSGSYSNTATVSAAQDVSDSDTHEQQLDGVPGLTLIKSGQLNDDDQNGLDPGDTIDYAFTIENTGNVTLTGITVTDTGALVSGSPIAILAPGAVDSASYSATYEITQADIDAGSYENTATVSSVEGASNTGTEIVALNGSPSLSLFITSQWIDSDESGDASAGDEIQYDFDLLNSGNVTLNNVRVTLSSSNQGVTVNGGPIATLSPDAVDDSTITGVYSITQNDVDNGSYVLFATGRSDQVNSTSERHETSLPSQ
ncbi:MAG: DUF7507 domain-containing protein [Candidatus Wenzhouxiangella sp. M2_3B_020]